MAFTRPRAAQIDFDVTNISDPLIRLNSAETGSADKDVGIVIERGDDTNVAIIYDESADEFALVNTTETGTTSGNVTVSSYADIRANAFYGDGSNLTGVSSSSDLTIAADNGSDDTVAIGTDTLTIAGGTGIDTTVSDNNISIAIDSTVATLTGTQTLTNKTINTASNTITIVEADISDLGTYLTSVELNDVSDVTLTSSADGEFLKYNGSAWVNSTLSTSAASITADSFTGDNSTTAFTVTTAPADVDSLLVTINGITQRPTTDYTVSGTTLTFGTAPFTGANIFARLIGGSVGGGGSTDLSAITESIIPDTDVTYDLGTSSKRFRDLYLSGSTIDLGGATMSIDGTSGAIALVPKATTGTPNPVGVVFTGSGELKTVTSSGGVVSSSDIETAADSNDVSPSTTVVTNPTDLPSSPTAGTMGYVTSNNKLYIYTGSGWYVVAAVNGTPTVSGANASYDLATDQTPTVVTLSATDPEGLPITWSSTTSGLGSIATVTNVDNVFTITPSADTGGTFSVTFRASDGVNIGTANSSFSLVFTVENSNYTRLLVKADAVSTDNQVDASSSSHTITETGNVTSTAFTPYHPGGYSVDFDGSGDYLQSASNADFGFGTGDFTVEWWANQTQLNSYSIVFAIGYGTGGMGSHMRSNGDITVSRPGTAIDHTFTAGVTSANRWYHVALVRSGTDLTCFVDGVSKGTVTNSTNYAAGNLNIGIDGNNGSSPYNGYISDFRIVKGTAVYTSNFTPPTERLTAITNTKLLTCHLPYIADGSSNNRAITTNGNASTKRFGPYDTFGYTKANQGGSVYFDGTGDYLSASNSADFSIAGDLSWTIEGWWYWNSNSGEQVLIEKFTGGTGPGWTLYKLNGGPIGLYSGSSGAFSNAIHTVTTGQWYHVAVCRDTTTNRTRAFINGKLKVDSTYSIGNNSSGNLYIGTRNGSGSYMNGYVSDVRVINGTALYTADFTPPTAPLTAITNTKLLTCTNKNDIWEQGSGSLLTKVGNTTASNTQRKFTGSSAIYLDGSGDYITYPGSDFDVFPEDFTIEWWQYWASNVSNYGTIYDNNYTTSPNLLIQTHDPGNVNQYKVFMAGFSTILIESSAASTGQWYHYALVRNGSTITMYRNGTSTGSVTLSGSIGSSAGTKGIGAASNGNYPMPESYIQDFRITKGLARYTANFTPPSSEFNG